MKVLVLERGAKERSLIRQALEKTGHEILLAEDMQQAWKMIEKDEARFVIADGDADDFQDAGLIGRVRAADLPATYFLVLSNGDGFAKDADDNLKKPFSAPDLAARLVVGQRILALGDSLSQARDQLENMAMYDSLTGIMNHTAFFKVAQGELERARRTASPLSMIVLDVDNFKKLNEQYGIETGDNVLKILSQNIREKSRPYDCIGRWTGDEFVVALPGVIGSDAEKIAERVIKGIRSTRITHEDKLVNVGVSAGIASASHISAATEVEPLIEQAKQAMARAKEAGGNQVYLSYV